MTEAEPLPFWKACLWAAALCLFGAMVAQGAFVFAGVEDPTVPHASNFYLYTFVRFEPAAIGASVGFFVFLGAILCSGAAVPSLMKLLASPRLPLVAAALLLVCISVGRFAVYHDFDLCIDEYLNDFEVKILDHHQLLAAVPAEWRSFAPAMTVAYERYHPDTGLWASGFLPGFAMLQAILGSVGLDWAVSPVLAAMSLLLLGSIARRIYPDQRALASNIAVLLLAASPQFVAMAMTKFAWTAQLFGTLLWVWLLVQPRRFLFLLTPVVGALLIGLHQPHVHPLVAAPFILRLASTRRWGDFAWFALCYLAGAWAWFQVYSELRPDALAPGGDLSNMGMAGSSVVPSAILSCLFAMFHGATLLGWVTPIVVPLLGIFVSTWRAQPAVARDGLLAALLTFGFYLLFPHPQGHGWGFRYVHAAYGMFALAAAGGALALGRQPVYPRLLLAVVASVVFSVAVQWPYRAYEISSLVRPLALTSAYIARQPADFVVIKTDEFWYADDLIRNDPWLQQKPLVFDSARLTPDQLSALRSRGKVEVMGADEVRKFGVILSDPRKKPAP